MVSAIASGLAINNVAPAQLRPEHSSTTYDPADLLERWSAGDWTELTDEETIRALVASMPMDTRTEVTSDQADALRDTIARLLIAYSSKDFSKYIEFRDLKNLAGEDDSWVMKRMAAIRETWPPRYPVPSSYLEAVEFGWNDYINNIGDGTPTIKEVNPRTLRVLVRSMGSDDYIPSQWDGMAGKGSGLQTEFSNSGIESIGSSVNKLMIPNRVSVDELIKKHGSVKFFDYQMIQRSSPDPAYPMLFRFVWDPDAGAWLPLHAMSLWNGENKRHVFVW